MKTTNKKAKIISLGEKKRIFPTTKIHIYFILFPHIMEENLSLFYFIIIIFFHFIFMFTLLSPSLASVAAGFPPTDINLLDLHHLTYIYIYYPHCTYEAENDICDFCRLLYRVNPKTPRVFDEDVLYHTITLQTLVSAM